MQAANVLRTMAGSRPRSWNFASQGAAHPGKLLARIWGTVFSLLLHGAVVAVLLRMEPARPPLERAPPIVVDLVQAPEPKPPAPVMQPPKPEPVVRQSRPRPQPQPQPKQPVAAPVPVVPPAPVEPVIAASTPIPSATGGAEAPVDPAPLANPAPPAPVAEAPAPATPLPPVSEPRFDAAYLNNPAPAYPALSRRLGEQGRVLVRVHVDANGMPTSVMLRASSGHERLDTVALETVRRWKFSPARRGDEAVSAWVIVPILFNLRS